LKGIRPSAFGIVFVSIGCWT